MIKFRKIKPPRRWGVGFGPWFFGLVRFDPPSNQDAEMIRMLQTDNARMRAAGLKIAEAACHVIREYDGTHRLALAVAEWTTALADECGRGERYKEHHANAST